MLKKAIIIMSLSMMVLLLMFSCSSMSRGTKGQITRGSVVEVTGKEVYVTIGNSDGVKAGDEFTLFKHTQENLGGVTKATKGKPEWVKIEMGKVKITEVVNDHYSKGTVTSGTAAVHYVVELK